MAARKRAPAGQTSSVESTFTPSSTAPRPRLKQLLVRNLGCIGADPVTIELDDIVVLVGPNNAGKSTILRAYELAMSDGSTKAKLTLDDFPNRTIVEQALPEIELHTVVYDNSPGEQWVDRTSGEGIVRERWTWSADGIAPKRQGFSPTDGGWSPSGVPWGATNVANGKRPQPHRIEAFAQPEKQAEQVSELLLTTLREKIRSMPSTVSDETGELVQTEYGRILDTFASLQAAVVKETQDQIKSAEVELTNFIGEIFRGYKVEFDARPEEDLSNALSFFKAGAQLRMGPEAGFLSSIDRQGSGARRALMWAALRFVTENGKSASTTRPHVLLLDEPELCLHPNAVRDACKVLYDLPASGNWQVMVTTHSPAFVDLSRDNTTIVRVDRTAGDKISATTVFRPATARLSIDEKTELKLLNLCDPYFAEFFFGGKTVIVEGDTEFTALNIVRRQCVPEFDHIHVVRARGKSIIALLARILNQFGGSYAVLHDSDSPSTYQTRGGVRREIVNPSWTSNGTIQGEVARAAGAVRVIAALDNFEVAVFRQPEKSDKPYNAKVRLESEPDACEKVRTLLLALTDFEQAVPDGFLAWRTLDGLRAAREEWISVSRDTDDIVG